MHKFLVDEGVDRSIVEGLRVRGYDVFFVVEEIRSLTDESLLSIATNESRILVTRDKDFWELVFRLGKAHAGVILLRLEGLETKERASIVCKQIEKYSTELENSFIVMQKDMIRIRKIG